MKIVDVAVDFDAFLFGELYITRKPLELLRPVFGRHIRRREIRQRRYRNARRFWWFDYFSFADVFCTILETNFACWQHS